MFPRHKNNPIKLVMTLLVRDNEDVLKENIEFHLKQGVDFFIAMDNLSIDQSTSILKDYEKKGLLHYIHQSSEGFHQAEWVTQMARLAASKYRADWVINNDADEFWWPSDTSMSLKQVLSALPQSAKTICCDRKNFVLPDDETDDVAAFYKRMLFKDMHSKNTLGEPLPPKVAHRASRWIKVGAGNHSAKFPWRHANKTQAKPDIEIFHFPFRHIQQVMDKVRLCEKTLKHSADSAKTFATWKELSDRLDSDNKIVSFVKDITYDRTKLKQGLSNGSLEKDTRLKTYLEMIFPDA